MKDRRLPGLAFLMLGVFTFVLYRWIYDYVLVVACGTSCTFFLFEREFIKPFLSFPGGLVQYGGRFLVQFYESPWLGSLVVTGLVVGLGLLLYAVLRRLTRAGALFFALLPCILLATAVGGEPSANPPLNFFIIDYVIGLIVSTCAFLVYLRLPHGAARRLYTAAAIPALYLLSGGWFWIFALWAIITEAIESRGPGRVVWPLLLAALAAAVPPAAWRWYFQNSLSVTLRGAFLTPTVFGGAYPGSAIALFAYLAPLPLWSKAIARAMPANAARPRRRVVAGAALAALAAVALPWVFYDSQNAQLGDYTRLYREGRWDEILHKAEHTRSTALATQFFTNFALCRKGRLLDEMFRYPQPWRTRGLIFNYDSLGVSYYGTPEDDYDLLMYNSDLFFAMGHVNLAFVQAFDYIALYGRTYESVKRMAECCMVNGNYALATKYLTMLERTLFHRGYAREYKALLADAHAADARFAEQRSLLPTVELSMHTGNFVPLLSLVKSNPHNRMAVDYLMAWCLLDAASLPMLAENVGALKAAGYRSVPAHVQEALGVVQAIHGFSAAPPDLRYDPAVAAKLSAFAEQARRCPDKASAQQALAPEFSDTFPYYAAFVARPREPGRGLQQLFVAKTFQSLGRTEDAIEHYRQALKIAPGLAEAHAALGELLKAQGDLEQAGFHEREARRLKKETAPSAPPAWMTPPTKVE